MMLGERDGDQAYLDRLEEIRELRGDAYDCENGHFDCAIKPHGRCSDSIPREDEGDR